jgi:hypothetical protein
LDAPDTVLIERAVGKRIDPQTGGTDQRLIFKKKLFRFWIWRIFYTVCESYLKASFHSGKLSVDWNGQENFSLSCELWVGTNDFNTKKNFLVRSSSRIIFLSGD